MTAAPFQPIEYLGSYNTRWKVTLTEPPSSDATTRQWLSASDFSKILRDKAIRPLPLITAVIPLHPRLHMLGVPFFLYNIPSLPMTTLAGHGDEGGPKKIQVDFILATSPFFNSRSFSYHVCFTSCLLHLLGVGKGYFNTWSIPHRFKRLPSVFPTTTLLVIHLYNMERMSECMYIPYFWVSCLFTP